MHERSAKTGRFDGIGFTCKIRNPSLLCIAVIIDVWLMWRKLKAKLIAKYGEQSVSKGSRSFSYAWSRSIQMRRWRLPKPRYPKRGHWPAD